MVDQHGTDRLGLSLAGLHVGGQDLVARFQLADGDGGAGGQQYLRAAGEGLAAATGRFLLAGLGSGVFCGKDAEPPPRLLRLDHY